MYPATTGAKQRMIITENYHYRCDHLPRWHLAGRALVLERADFRLPTTIPYDHQGGWFAPNRSGGHSQPPSLVNLGRWLSPGLSRPL